MKKTASETKSKYTAEQRPMIEKMISDYDNNGKKKSPELEKFCKENGANPAGLKIFLKSSTPGYINPRKGKKNVKNKLEVTKSGKLGRPKGNKEKATGLTVMSEYMVHIPTGDIYRESEFKPLLVKIFK